jgi:hypothetical protein
MEPLIIHLSLKVLVNEPPSMFPNRVPIERDASSPEPVVFFIHSYLSGALPRKGGKHTVTIHGALYTVTSTCDDINLATGNIGCGLGF